MEYPSPLTMMDKAVYICRCGLLCSPSSNTWATIFIVGDAPYVYPVSSFTRAIVPRPPPATPLEKFSESAYCNSDSMSYHFQICGRTKGFFDFSKKSL